MAEAQQHGQHRSRPFGVTLVTWGVFFLGLANSWRAFALYRQGGLLLELGVSLDPRLRLLLALIWALLFFMATAALLKKWAPARAITPMILVGYAVYEVGLARLFTRPASLPADWSAIVILYALAILFTSWALNRKAARRYFESEE